MSTLSVKQAIKEISALKTAAGTSAEKLEKFNNVIARITPGAEVTDKKFTFWSGGFSPNYQSSGSRWENISSNIASTSLANQSDEIGIIKESNYAKVLLDRGVQSDYLEIKGVDPDDKAAVKAAQKEYASGLNGPWGQASQSVAENVRGDVLAFTPYETGKSTVMEHGTEVTKSNNIFADREFPALLNNPNVQSINGLSTEDLRKIRDNPDLGIDAARHEVNLASREYVKGLHTQPSLTGDKLCFNKEFMDKQSLKEVDNFQSKLDNPKIKSVDKNSPEIQNDQEAFLNKKYREGNPLHAGKVSQIDKGQDVDLKEKIEKEHGVKAFESRSGKFPGTILETSNKQVAQQVGKHIYVHKMNPKEHNLNKGDMATIRTNKGHVQSVEKMSMDKRKDNSRHM